MEQNQDILLEERDFIKEILTIVEQTDDIVKLEMILDEYHPYDLSRAFVQIDSEINKKMFLNFKLDFTASIFEHFSEEEAIEALKLLPIEYGVKIVDKMESDDAVDLLQYLEAEAEDIDLFSLLSPRKRAELSKLLVYKENEIGSAMSGSFIRIFRDMTVKEAMKKVVSIAGETDYIAILYVIDKHKLVGYLKLKNLIVARAEEKIADIMESRLIYAKPNDDKEDVSNLMQDYGESSMPIVDGDMHLIGIVTHDDLMDIVSEAKSEDYAKFAGLIDGEIDLDKDSIAHSIKQRLPWLSILLILSMVTSMILSFFEGSLTATQGAIILSTRLAIYLPLILGMAGNTGTQSLAVMVRYLATAKKEMTRKSMFRYLMREIGTGIFQGLIIGALVFVMVSITNLIIRGVIFEYVALVTALVTAGSIFIALFVSTVLGALIPLGMDKMKIDPAVASGPFITTVSDIISLTIYYSISLAILLPLYN